MRQKIMVVCLMAAAACVVAPDNCWGGWSSKKTSPRGAGTTAKPPAATVTVPDTAQLLETLVSRAEVCAQAGKWRTAAFLTDRADGLASSKSAATLKSLASIKGRITKLYGQFDAEAEKRMAASKKCAADKEFAEAFKGYVSVELDFPCRPTATKATKALAAAAKDSKCKPLVDAARAEGMEQTIAMMIDGRAAKGKSRVAKIKCLAAPDREAVLAQLKKLATTYPKTPQGKQAAKDLDAL